MICIEHELRIGPLRSFAELTQEKLFLEARFSPNLALSDKAITPAIYAQAQGSTRGFHY